MKGHSSEQLGLQIAELEGELARLRTRLFSSTSSEERGGGEVKKPKTGHGPKAQPKLEGIDEPHALDAADQTCTWCGGTLTEWEGQAEESFEIDVEPRRFVLKRHPRKMYRGACGACIETAPAPPKLCSGSRYSIDFAIEVAVCKYPDVDDAALVLGVERSSSRGLRSRWTPRSR